MVLDALCGVLTGALFGQDVRRGGIPNTPQAMGQLFMALDVGHMMPVDEFKQRMDVQIRQMRNSDKAKGVERVYLPGEIELERKENFLRDGIAFASRNRGRPGRHGRDPGHAVTLRHDSKCLVSGLQTHGESRHAH